MERALAQARLARAAGEVPVGALIVSGDAVVAEGCNASIARNDPTAHAEIVALRAAGRQLGNYRMPDTTLYVTLEPCAMCAGAIVQARIARVVFGAADPRAGAAGSVMNVLGHAALNHRPHVTGGVEAEACAAMLTDFFRARRAGP